MNAPAGPTALAGNSARSPRMTSHVVGQVLPLQCKKRLLLLKVERHVVLLLVIHMTLCHDGLDQPRIELRLRHVVAPVLPEALSCTAQVVPGNVG